MSGRPRQRAAKAEHGTVGMYGNHGCRCDKCKEANRLSHAEYTNKLNRKCIDCGKAITYKRFRFFKRCINCDLEWRIQVTEDVSSSWIGELLSRMYGEPHTLECERCGDMANLFHHKDRNRRNNDDGNIEVLCHSCHNQEHGAKVSPKEVIEIRKLYEQGDLNMVQLASKYDVNVSTISRIIARKSWRNY